MRVFTHFDSCSPTDGPTDGRTDKASYRVACPQLKMNIAERRSLNEMSEILFTMSVQDKLPSFLSENELGRSVSWEGLVSKDWWP